MFSSKKGGLNSVILDSQQELILNHSSFSKNALVHLYLCLLSCLKVKNILRNQIYGLLGWCTILCSLGKRKNNNFFIIIVIIFILLKCSRPWPVRDLKSFVTNIELVPLRFPYDKQISQESKDFLSDCLVVEEERRIDWEGIFNHPLTKRAQGLA